MSLFVIKYFFLLTVNVNISFINIKNMGFRLGQKIIAAYNLIPLKRYIIKTLLHVRIFLRV